MSGGVIRRSVIPGIILFMILAVSLCTGFKRNKDPREEIFRSFIGGTGRYNAFLWKDIDHDGREELLLGHGTSHPDGITIVGFTESGEAVVNPMIGSFGGITVCDKNVIAKYGNHGAYYSFIFRLLKDGKLERCPVVLFENASREQVSYHIDFVDPSLGNTYDDLFNYWLSQNSIMLSEAEYRALQKTILGEEKDWEEIWYDDMEYLAEEDRE